jgi:hypothetical protein
MHTSEPEFPTLLQPVEVDTLSYPLVQSHFVIYFWLRLRSESNSNPSENLRVRASGLFWVNRHQVGEIK